MKTWGFFTGGERGKEYAFNLVHGTKLDTKGRKWLGDPEYKMKGNNKTSNERLIHLCEKKTHPWQRLKSPRISSLTLFLSELFPEITDRI